jgi:tRNA A37 methylthiotransferase MiaB
VVTAPTIIADNYKAAETSSSTTTTTGVESSFSREESPGRLIGDKKSVEGIPKAVIPSELLPENDDFSAKPIRGHSVRAWVNVIYGCNEHCTYCV